MTTNPLIIGKYVYIHDNKGISQAIDSHQILLRKRRAMSLLLCLTILFVLANICYFLLFKEHSVAFFPWNILPGIIFFKRLYGKSIKKESIVIMPGFGVQLETHHQSRRVIRHFVPIGKILKPVLNECVTPVTCYWSLALILRDEEELMLVFRELRPPLKMLVPVWKALCAATNCEASMTMVAEEN